MILVIYSLLGLGFAWLALGTLALHRFPDPYTRLHGGTLCTTGGSILMYLGIMLYGIDAGSVVLPAHTMLVLVILLLANPTSAHAIARAAHRSGVKPKNALVDKLGRAGGQP